MFDFFRRKKDKEKKEEFTEANEENISESDEINSDQSSFDDKESLVFESDSQQSYDVNENIQEDLNETIENETNEYEDTFTNYSNIDYETYDDEVGGENQVLKDNKIDQSDQKLGFFDRIREGLVKTRDQFSSQVKNLFTANVKIDDEMFEELEEILISADIGMETTLAIVDSLRYEINDRNIKDSDQIYPLLEEIMVRHLDRDNLNNDLNIVDNELAIILVIGVNGVGKTTTIGKLAYNLKQEGKTVMLAAADTFRAAAIEQLGEWADKADVEMISHSEGADPSAVIFDAIQSAKSKNIDVLICDTAGRLHNKKNLMKELEKINKTIDTHAGKATRDNILVLDATTGQNAVNQLREFKNVTDITGLILTKLDGTAKGGIIFPLQYELNVPVKYIGLGEGIDNLEKFNSKSFVDALF